MQEKAAITSTGRYPFWVRACVAVAMTVWLVGCASPKHKAPVEDRGAPSTRAPTPPPAASAADPAKPPLPGAENAGKPGYYTVKPGDTLIRIGLETGQVWRDIARWNNLENPHIIEVGQVLLVNPAAVDASTGVSARPVTTARVETRPLDARGAASAPAPASAVQPSASAAAQPASTLPSAVPAPQTKDFGDDDVNWAWPASGPVTAQFDDVRQKGLAISGRAGDPVLAAADGRVVYAGSGLRGYGNLVIIKHNNTFLTAYAHNQTLLVKEDQAVRKGQKIAEMGSSDTDRVQLHFEIRKLGKPVDPSKLLPPR